MEVFALLHIDKW